MKNLKHDFLLEENITYLNFASFGACPKPIFENYIHWQYELEKEPVQFIAHNAIRYLQTSREALAKFIHCHVDDIVLLTNPSYAVNLIAKSFPLKEGDEVLSTQLEYGACERTWKYYCEKAGAIWRIHQIQLPIQSEDEIVEHFFKEVNSKTKLIFISHITSSTALRLPVEKICKKAKELGIITFIDGAHAPGHIPLHIESLNVDIYMGACHKWMMTPKGCSFLYVKKELQNIFDPLVISWGYHSDTPSHSQFLDYHQMQGTRDFSAMLTIPAAIEYMNKNNWEIVKQECRNLVIDNAPRFFELLQTQPITPLNETFLGQMCSVEIKTKQGEYLQKTLFENFQIEVPIMKLGTKNYLRYSINAFNSQNDLDKLYSALKKCIQLRLGNIFEE